MSDFQCDRCGQPQEMEDMAYIGSFDPKDTHCSPYMALANICRKCWIPIPFKRPLLCWSGGKDCYAAYVNLRMQGIEPAGFVYVITRKFYEIMLPLVREQAVKLGEPFHALLNVIAATWPPSANSPLLNARLAGADGIVTGDHQNAVMPYLKRLFPGVPIMAGCGPRDWIKTPGSAIVVHSEHDVDEIGMPVTEAYADRGNCDFHSFVTEGLNFSVDIPPDLVLRLREDWPKSVKARL
jgi:hypothetical protein